MFNTKEDNSEKTLLISVLVDHWEDIDQQEFYLLAVSAGAKLVDHWVVQRDKPNAKTFVGSGKVLEIANFIKENEIELVIFDRSLTPIQKRNLEQAIQCRIIDRIGLILDIFAQRARSYEGKLQVELAQLEYLSAQLIRGRNLGRQKGGIGLRGPGETKLETDRRLLRVRMGQLRAKLDKVQLTRQQGRALRQKSAIPTVSLVGYTNAGKSTLFNLLAESDVYAADQLFATLDPTLRRLEWDGVGTLVLADTVGFVRDLPHTLVESFKATLEETLQATLLLHVIDSHNPEMYAQIEAVEQVLKEIGADVPTIRVYNKIDQTGEAEKVVYNQQGVAERVYLSAHQNRGVDLLIEAVQSHLVGQLQVFHLQLDYHQVKLRHQFYKINAIEQEYYDDNGMLRLEVRIAKDKLREIITRSHFSLVEILGEQAKQFDDKKEEWQ